MQAQSKISKRFLLSLFLVISFVPYQNIFPKSVVFFSPDDKPKKHLIEYIKNAKARIYAAVYMFTDKNIAQALIDAKKEKKVDVQIITDQTSVSSIYGKIHMLKENGIKTFVFKTSGYYKFEPIMHHKFAIIDNNVWTGSFNWTVSANKQNQENVIYTDEKDVCKKYLDQFEKLKGRCGTKLIAKNKTFKRKHRRR